VSEIPMIDLSSGFLTQVIDTAIDRLFTAGASDITIQSDDFVWAYINRRHECVSNRRLDDREVSEIARHMYNSDGVFGMLGSGKPLDFELDVRPRLDAAQPDFNPDYSVRCRANVTPCRVGGVANGISITLRTIPGLPPPYESLDLPDDVTANIFPSQGLVLVVGITGSGKSTLLAACNRKRQEGQDPKKIGTYEDPVEYIYNRLPALNIERGVSSARMPEVSQVQIGTHMREFDLASANALRRKFDVLVMGEMRDKVSVETGLMLASTGHAAYATLHCETPAEAISRIVSYFPYDSQPSVANKLLANLRLIVAQKIERTTAGKGKAYRSWCVFDQNFKAQLGEMRHEKWGREINHRMTVDGVTFAQQAYPDYCNGVLSIECFATVAGFNPKEAREFIAAHQQGVIA
jgi:defect-in-organelle-trafficking protein DotB